MSTGLGNPSGGALRILNNLSEIAASGAVAQSAARANLGLSGTGATLPTQTAPSVLASDGAAAYWSPSLVLPTLGGAANQEVAITPKGAAALWVRPQGNAIFGAIRVVGYAANAESSIGFSDATDVLADTWVVGKNLNGTTADQLGFYRGSTHISIDPNGPVLFGTVTPAANGRLQLTTHTTLAGGIGFGSDVSLFRSGANALETNASLKTAAPGGAAGAIRLGSVTAGAVAIDAANYWEVSINGVVKKVLLAA